MRGSQNTSGELLFSVVVTTYNRKCLLKACLGSLLTQEYPLNRYEILVVDDGGKDGTEELVCSMTEAGTIRYFYQSNRGWAAARNLGLAHSRGPIVVFIDDDCLAAPDWLLSYEEAYAQHPEVGGVAGRVTCGPQANLAGKIRFQGHVAIFNELNAPLGTRYDTPGYVTFSYGANRSYRRAILSSDEPFDPDLRYFEDHDLDLRLRKEGVAIFYDPKIVVQHDYRLSARGRIMADFYYGRSRVLFMNKHPGFSYPTGGKPPVWQSLSRILKGFPEESTRAKASYLIVQAACRAARSLGALSGRKMLAQIRKR